MKENTYGSKAWRKASKLGYGFKSMHWTTMIPMRIH